MMWAASVAEEAILLLNGTDGVSFSNDAAAKLAAALALAEPKDLLGFIPSMLWEIAFRQSRARGEVATSDGGPVLEMKVFAGTVDGVLKQYVIMSDISLRSHREAELVRRREELEATYSRLGSAQEQLIHAEKLASIGQLAAGVAHEINNPIGYVHSNLGTLQEYVSALLNLIDQYGDAAHELGAPTLATINQARERLDVDFIVGDLPKLLEESREGIERVTKIVQDLKEFSYVDRDPSMKPADLRKGLETTLNITWNDLKYKATIERQYDDIPLVECNMSEINQVFMNLLINAGQAISNRGVIGVAIGANDTHAWVIVSDTGSGIPEESQQRIFDPFYTTKPIGSGTGLGLAICSRIVAKHHGQIEVTSRMGMGSTFKVTLPLVQPKS